MPLIRKGNNFYIFVAGLGFNALLAVLTKVGGNKGIKSKKGAIISFGEFFRPKHFFKNCGPYCIRGP